MAAVATALTSASIVSAAAQSPTPSPVNTASLNPQEKKLLQSDKPATIAVDPSTGQILGVSEGKSAVLGEKTVNLDPYTGHALSLSQNGENP
ncbi:hypothetical protein [Microbispora sp. NPDC049633]|uniref:hypothetical protein n=1 Tax=Microbispora sp. NPDC049633 TaxID=3154355 RepID=UPI00341E56B6